MDTPAYGSRAQQQSVRIRLRDALVEILKVRRGKEIDDEIIADRSNNGAFYLEEIVEDIVRAALKEAARGEVVGGLIDGARPRTEMPEGTVGRMGGTAETLEERMHRTEPRVPMTDEEWNDPRIK